MATVIASPDPSHDPYQRVAGIFDTVFEPMNRGLRLIGMGMDDSKGFNRNLNSIWAL